MRNLVIGLSLSLAVALPSETTWETEVQSGKLPEMTLQQQMQLFDGARLLQTTESPPPPTLPPPTAPQPWWHAMEAGRLPPLSYEQKKMLFGATDVEEQQQEQQQFSSYPGWLEDGEGSPSSGRASTSRSRRSLSSSVNLNDTRGAERESATKADISQGRGRLRKILVPVLLAVTIIAAILLPALMTVIKLIAVKGLWSGVVSLIISKLLGLKALLNHHHHTTDHEHHHATKPYFVYLPQGHGHHRRGEDVGDPLALEENIQRQQEQHGRWEEAHQLPHS